MKPVVDSVLPLFALILAGYLCGWFGLLGAGATDSLNRFVVWLARAIEPRALPVRAPLQEDCRTGTPHCG